MELQQGVVEEVVVEHRQRRSLQLEVVEGGAALRLKIQNQIVFA